MWWSGPESNGPLPGFNQPLIHLSYRTIGASPGPWSARGPPFISRIGCQRTPPSRARGGGLEPPPKGLTRCRLGQSQSSSPLEDPRLTHPITSSFQWAAGELNPALPVKSRLLRLGADGPGVRRRGIEPRMPRGARGYGPVADRPAYGAKAHHRPGGERKPPRIETSPGNAEGLLRFPWQPFSRTGNWLPGLRDPLLIRRFATGEVTRIRIDLGGERRTHDRPGWARQPGRPHLGRSHHRGHLEVTVDGCQINSIQSRPRSGQSAIESDAEVP